MVGLSDAGLYQRDLLLLETNFRNVKNEPARINLHQKPHVLTEPMISLAFDLQQKIWIARGRNWELVRGHFMGALSGTCRTDQTNLVLECPRGEILIHQYYSNDAPRREGKAFRSTHPMNANKYAQEINWLRYGDPTMMTPFERFSEMLDRAVRSERLKAMVRDELGGIVSAEALLLLGGNMFVLLGTGLVAGERAAWVMGHLLGVTQFAFSAYDYHLKGKEVYSACQNAKTANDLKYGADALTGFLSQLIVDLAAMLGMHLISKLALRLLRMLREITPERVKAAVAEAGHRAHAVVKGEVYAQKHLLQNAAGTPLEPAAIRMFEKTSEQHREIIVLREPDTARLTWIEARHVANNAKPTWLKAQSSKGWHGLVCLTSEEAHGGVQGAAGKLVNTGRTFELGNFRGVSPEIDAYIAQHPRAPMFEMPTDGRKMGKAIDYSENNTGHNHINLKSHKLVQVGDKFLVVDGLGRPYISDIDVASRQQMGKAHAGEHLPEAPRVGERVRPGEDNWLLEYEMNKLYVESGGHPDHMPNQHSGGGGTVRYTRRNLALGNKPHEHFWSPKMPDGSYKKERLVIFLPEKQNGRIKSKMYVLNSWEDFRAFAKANNLEFPF